VKPFLIRVLALAQKEALHMLRDVQVIYLALGMPLVLVLLFGYAVSFDVDEVAIAVVDQDRTSASRQFLFRLDAGDAFRVVEQLDDPNEIEPLFLRGRVKAGIVVPAGYARSLARGERAPIQAVIDGADGTTARIVNAYSSAAGQAQTLELLSASIDVSAPLQPRVRTWFNPTMESALFVVPGLVGVVLAILAVLLSALTVAREWERGSMEQLFATPVDRLSVVLGKVAPYVALGMLQFMLVLTAGAWLFDVPIRGNFALLVLAVGLFLVCVLGQGLLISMITKSQQVAVQVGAISAILPSLLLSGFLFPIANMPPPLRLISNIVPARYLIVCLRGALLQGRGFAELWPQLLGLALLGTLIITATTRKFRRRLD
jgi:ABC-2 type transport system permease protein